MGCFMESVIRANASASEHNCLEVDGKKLSEYATFTEALKAGLEFKKKSPHSTIKVYEVEEQQPNRN